MNVKSTRLKVGDSIAIKYAKKGSSTALELGKITRIRNGRPRTIVITMDDGLILYMLAETPKRIPQSEATPPESPEPG